MRVKLAAIGFGAVFGFAISWGQFIDPDRIREMLLLNDLYLYAMMGTAMAVGFVGAALFGVGWAITDSCPAPVAGQLAHGVGWALFTLAGVMLGIGLYLRRQERPAPTPARPASGAGQAPARAAG